MDEFKVVHFGEDESQPEPAQFANASEAETKRIEEIIPYMPTTFRGLLQAAITHGLLREEEAELTLLLVVLMSWHLLSGHVLVMIIKLVLLTILL